MIFIPSRPYFQFDVPPVLFLRFRMNLIALPSFFTLSHESDTCIMLFLRYRINLIPLLSIFLCIRMNLRHLSHERLPDEERYKFTCKQKMTEKVLG